MVVVEFAAPLLASASEFISSDIIHHHITSSKYGIPRSLQTPMSQPIHILPSSSPHSSPHSPHPHVDPANHTCHWDWCRLAFPSNALLIHHVIHEHVHKAQPVRRRDLPILRRVKDGVGESWRFSVASNPSIGEFLFALLESLVLCVSFLGNGLPCDTRYWLNS